jgi:hypothetical protein
MTRPVLILLLCPWRGAAADVTFSGALESLGHETISVRLADQRVIEARLPNTRNLSAEKIAAQYQIGDQVQISCKAIQPALDEETSRMQFLELTRLRFLRQPSPQQRSAIPAPGADTPPTADPKLNHARDVNLEYVANMPNFVADETAKRYTGHGKSGEWRFLDTIDTEVTFKGNRALRQQVRRDGKPWNRPFQALPGFKWSGGFGTEIKPIFNPQCPTSIEYVGRAERRGKQLLEYKFSSPADGCFGAFTVEYQRYTPARTGRVFIEDPGGNVIQLEEEAVGFPAAFDFAHRTEEVSWDYVKIGDASHLLPVAANFVVLYANGSRFRVDIEFRNHRHFESSTNVTFH